MDAFENVLEVITSERFQDIEKFWDSIPLAECGSSDSGLDKRINGLYALKHPKYGIIYIGKGKPIFRRVLSHHKATQGNEKAPAWKQFFSVINSDITVYWYSVDHPDIFVAEQYREALERLLQIKYKPLFDVMYSETGHKELGDFNERLEEMLSK